MKKHPDAPGAIIDRVTLPTATASSVLPKNEASLNPAVATPGLPRPVTDGKVETRSGRWIPRPPHLYTDTDAAKREKRKQYDAWLVEQAIAEAAARGDTVNGEQFERIDAAMVHAAGRGELHNYLFGEEIPLFRDPEPNAKLAAPKLPSDFTDTQNDIAWTEQYLAGVEARKHGQPAVGDAVMINKTTRGTIKRIKNDEYHIEVMTASGGKGIRKASRFQIEQAASAEAPTEESAETERTMTGEEVAQLLQSGRDAVLPDNIIPAEPVPPAAPEKIWPRKTFQWEGVTYRFPDHLQMIGQPYDEGTLNTQEVAEGKDPEALSQRSWGSLADFIRTTGFQVIADERYSAEDWRFLREMIAAKQMILIADTSLGLPTIHQMQNAQHHGLGFFSTTVEGCKINWDAGGAMRRTRPDVDGERNWNGISWTPLRVEEGTYPYPFDQVLAAIDWWLNMPQPEPAPAMKLVEVSVPVAPVDLPPAPDEEAAAPTAETPAEPEPNEPATDDFFDNWSLATAFDATTGVSALAIKPKKVNARKAARAVGRTDAFKKMMTSEPEFGK